MWCLQRTKFLNLLGDKTCSNSYLSKTTCLKEYESATQDSGEYDYISFFKIQYVNKKMLTFLEDKEHPSFNERNWVFFKQFFLTPSPTLSLLLQNEKKLLLILIIQLNKLKGDG